MQIILREDVQHLGEMGDIVNVKRGFARNYLLPRGLAVVADARQVNRLAHEKRIIEAKLAKVRAAAEAEKVRLDNIELKIEKAAGENDKLFGSVTAMDIEAFLNEKGIRVDRKKIQLADHIKALGDYDVAIKLHRDVVATIKVHVVAEAVENA